MTTISVSIDDRMYEQLAKLAEEPESLIRAYLEYLAAGGVPLPIDDGPRSSEIAELLVKSSAWTWLADEPDIYTVEDGEPV